MYYRVSFGAYQILRGYWLDLQVPGYLYGYSLHPKHLKLAQMNIVALTGSQTMLLRRVLHNREWLSVAVVVNDMSETSITSPQKQWRNNA